MSDNLKEHLLGEEKSVSPASSPPGSHRPSWNKQEEPSTQSQLSAALMQPKTQTSLMKLSPKKSNVVVHFWTNYNSGEHFFTDIEVFQDHRVLDVITKAVEHFSTQTKIPGNPNLYLMRFANKKGEPKSDMPVLDIGQKVIETNFNRFALCEKAQDEKSKEKLEPFKEEAGETEPEPKVETKNTQESQPEPDQTCCKQACSIL